MAAELITCGEHPPGVGGEFERACAQKLRDQLPDGYVVATNVSLSRGGGAFYECDAIVAAPGICDILEIKCLRPAVDVHEDLITTPFGYSADRVFSILDGKAKVLASRRLKAPFPRAGIHSQTYVKTMVVVPDDAIINVRHEPYRKTNPIRGISDAIEHYRRVAAQSSTTFQNPVGLRELRSGWVAYRDSAAKSARRSNQYLGKYLIRKRLGADPGSYEYWGVDEHPVQFDVHLREFPFDPTLSREQLEAYLTHVAREMRILRHIRHPDIACVTGHFQTGGSWVEVSDWFDGDCLDAVWAAFGDSALDQRLGVFLRIVRALQFCHERGVFHRNLSAAAVRVSNDFSEVRLANFEFARDVTRSAGSTTTTNRLTLRDARLVPPEELTPGRANNPRLGDIFQVGVLLYRVLERGAWPFTDTLELATSDGQLRQFQTSIGSTEKDLRALAVRMMAIEPSARPDILEKVEDQVARMAAG